MFICLLKVGSLSKFECVQATMVGFLTQSNQSFNFLGIIRFFGHSITKTIADVVHRLKHDFIYSQPTILQCFCQRHVTIGLFFLGLNNSLDQCQFFYKRSFACPTFQSNYKLSIAFMCWVIKSDNSLHSVQCTSVEFCTRFPPLPYYQST